MATTGTRSSRRSSSSAITYVVVNRFQGGITAQYDKVQIANGFSPMARNVEWREIGGIIIRQGVGPLPAGDVATDTAAPGGIPLAFYHYVRDPSTVAALQSQYLVALSDGRVRVMADYGIPITGVANGAWTNLLVGASPFNSIGPPTMAAWDTNLYLSCGVQATTSLGANMTRWAGNNPAVALGRAFNDNIAAPVGGNMPPARFIAMWQSRTWVAVTLHDSTPIDPSRIRWSHPGHPEDWQTNDYIDVGQAGDVITAIAPMRDMLVIFKRSSTYALLGSGASNFRVVEISGTIGCTGQWTRDNQDAVVFWDGSIGLCRFDGKGVTNLFEPLRQYLSERPPSINRCGGVVSDGDKIYVATDFNDFYGQRVPDPSLVTRSGEPHVDPFAAGPIQPGNVSWQTLLDNSLTWERISGFDWITAAYSAYNIVWVFRLNAGFTSFALNHPTAKSITCLGQLRTRVAASGTLDSNRRIVYGLGDGTVPLYCSDRFDDGTDHWGGGTMGAIDAFYMTAWLHAGLPAQIKRFKAPRIIQEADQPGNLLIDVFYDFDYTKLRRTLKIGVLPPGGSFDSYQVGKPGTIGRAKAVLLIVRPEVDAASPPRHWGVSSITIPVHPKVLR